MKYLAVSSRTVVPTNTNPCSRPQVAGVDVVYIRHSEEGNPSKERLADNTDAN
jgi:hypothetical protein